MTVSPNHPAGKRIFLCHCCPATRRQKLMPGGVDRAVLACPSCDPSLFAPNLSRKATP